MRIRHTALVALTPFALLAMGACSDDEGSKTPTDVDHDAKTLEAEVDDMLAEIDEVETIDSVASGILSD
jgi:hypothetical protein